VTNYAQEMHGLYRNRPVNGEVFFEFSTQASGIAAIGTSFIGWGTGFLDLDYRGWEDLVFVNGHERRHPYGRPDRAQKPVLLRNQGGGRFVDITPQGGPYFRRVHLGRGLGLGDLDNDGKIDLVVSHLNNEPVALLRNEVRADRRWLGVELAGKDGRDVVGARITLEAGGRTQTRFAQGGGSYLSSGDRRHVFGLGEAGRAGPLTVAWPSGQVQRWDDLAPGRYWRLVEGQKEAVARPTPPAQGRALLERKPGADN
jgi:hypothetical protein